MLQHVYVELFFFKARCDKTTILSTIVDSLFEFGQQLTQTNIDLSEEFFLTIVKIKPKFVAAIHALAEIAIKKNDLVE